MPEQEIIERTLCLGERTSWTPWLMGAGAALMIAVGVFIYLASRQRPML
jgi:hypothetical protein